jgi:outer membrane protein OmpA-like peptidoglycan-associated protein
MKMIRTSLAVACAVSLWAQEPNPTQRLNQESNVVQAGTAEAPIFRMTVIQRSIQAVNYRHRSGSTEVDLHGTELMPEARGKAKVNSKQGRLEVDADMNHMVAPGTYGPEYLTYVLWAVTPEGRATNLGEVLVNPDGKSKLDVTTELQAFGLIVTAEPYFGVTQPSDVVVMENIIRPETKGQWETVDAKYELLKRGQYVHNQNAAALRPGQPYSKVPLELYEARNAVQIARWAAADKYAADTFAKAQDQLNQAEAYLARKAGEKPVAMMARAAVETSEDARIISLRKQREEELARERQAAADREAAAKAKADEEARQRADAEARERAQAQLRAQAETARAQAETERLAAERAKAEALAAAQQAEQAKAAADEARAAALAEQQRLAAEAQKSQLQAQEADRLRQQAEADRERIRQELLQQLNMVLETRESARGLIVNMSDVLFDFGKATLKPGTREKLAKVAGIVLAHPGLTLEVEGHTDSIGSDEYNQKLSEARASAVRDYLAGQGIKSDAITARGFGKTQPVASNSTAEGRQRNRRVEMVVSGDIIGTKIQSMRLQAQPATPAATPPATTPPSQQ